MCTRYKVQHSCHNWDIFSQILITDSIMSVWCVFYVLSMLQKAWAVSILGIVIPTIKMRWWWDCLICIMGITILVIQHLYIEMAPFPAELCANILSSSFMFFVHQSLQWHHNGRDSVSNRQPHDCLLNCLFRHRSKIPHTKASDPEKVSIWWHHHVLLCCTV